MVIPSNVHQYKNTYFSNQPSITGLIKQSLDNSLVLYLVESPTFVLKVNDIVQVKFSHLFSKVFLHTCVQKATEVQAIGDKIPVDKPSYSYLLSSVLASHVGILSVISKCIATSQVLGYFVILINKWIKKWSRETSTSCMYF